MRAHMRCLSYIISLFNLNILRNTPALVVITRITESAAQEAIYCNIELENKKQIEQYIGPLCLICM